MVPPVHHWSLISNRFLRITFFQLPWVISFILNGFSAHGKEATPSKIDLEQYNYSETFLEDAREYYRKLPPVLRSNAPWIQFGFSGALYDARRETIFGRIGPHVQGGYRFDAWGVFGALDLERISDFTFDTEKIKLLNLGLGVEFLPFYGRIRSSISAGMSILLDETDIDEAGSVGWYIEIRPAGLRWNVGEKAAIEFTPLAFDFSAPVTEGIPLVFLSYSSFISMEWSIR